MVVGYVIILQHECGTEHIDLIDLQALDPIIYWLSINVTGYANLELRS